MKISELSRSTGVSVPTIKYYLREGLLFPGDPTGPNQADYGDAHVHRLRLIRVLMDVGGLGVAAIRHVLDALADERLSLHEVMGRAQYALGSSPRTGDDELPDDLRRAQEDVDRFLDGLAWHIAPDAPGRRALADALVSLRRLGRDVDADVFGPYAELADRLAAFEVAATRPDSRAHAIEDVVVGVVVFEAALVALRRLAQEHHSYRHHPPG